MRLVVGVSLIVNGIQKFQPGQSIELVILNVLTVGDGVLLIAGLWTPVVGSLVSVLAVWGFLTQEATVSSVILSATIGVGLALIGPGAWSMDAWLFGWKKIDIER